MTRKMRDILDVGEINPELYRQIFIEDCIYHGFSISEEGIAYYNNQKLNLEIIVRLVPGTQNFYSSIEVRYTPYIFNKETNQMEMGERKIKNIVIPTSFLKKELSRIPKAFFANRVEIPE
ncbi:MAG: hypothetical protein QXH92_04535 [Candidatus Aenigmatarchaeota archaeon]